MQRKSHHEWVIMNAWSWLRKPTIEKIIEEHNGEGVITVGVLIRNNQNIFILGAGDSPYAKNDETKFYIQDTGNGYGGDGLVRIENSIIIDQDGIVDPGNGLGLFDKRNLWVFK